MTAVTGTVTVRTLFSNKNQLSACAKLETPQHSIQHTFIETETDGLNPETHLWSKSKIPLSPTVAWTVGAFAPERVEACEVESLKQGLRPDYTGTTFNLWRRVLHNRQEIFLVSASPGDVGRRDQGHRGGVRQGNPQTKKEATGYRRPSRGEHHHSTCDSGCSDHTLYTKCEGWGSIHADEELGMMVNNARGNA